MIDLNMKVHGDLREEDQKPDQPGPCRKGKAEKAKSDGLQQMLDGHQAGMGGNMRVTRQVLGFHVSGDEGAGAAEEHREKAGKRAGDRP